jgi:two-component system, chemotaxis family, protein-glutamate methylesterase/glutaminase
MIAGARRSPEIAEQEQTGRGRIFVIGASAGGVEALTRLVRELPADLGAPMIVVLHVTPSGTSVLPAILSRAGRLRAVHVEDGMALEPGRIYVAPPDQHVLVENVHLRLSSGPRENGHRPAIDPLFRTAARAYEGRAVGVVLSGTRDDGTAGMIEVRRYGGIGVAQDPADALYPSMPQSAIALAKPEHVLDVPGIAALLARLAGGNPGNPTGAGSNAEGEVSRVEDGPNVAEHDEPTVPGRHEPPGEIVPFTCPECGGALWEIRDGALLRYRCHVGHGYSEQAIVSEQTGTVEAALWTALRMLQERAALLRKLASRFADGGVGSALFEARAEAAEEQARVVSELVQNVGVLGDPIADAEGESA